MSLSVKIKKRLSPAMTLDVEYETDGSACLGILGPSGSGKSMSLKCIAGIETPDEGRIVVDGEVLFDSARNINLKPAKRRIGYLFQQYALFPTMTLLENITAPLPGRQGLERARSLIHQFGLDGLEARRPRELSGGQQQRAALARMLIRRPRAVLLDEPFSALDLSLREYMQMEFAALLKAGGAESLRNAVVVTHSRDEVFRLCPKLAIIDNGAIVITGDTHAIFENPRRLAAARITGCKNISRVERVNAHNIYAADWGLPLRTTAEVSADITHVGIRAHNLADGTAGNDNTMTVSIKEEVSGPFETTLIFSNAQAEAGTNIWRQYPRVKDAIPARAVFFPPEQLLLLRDD